MTPVAPPPSLGRGAEESTAAPTWDRFLTDAGPRLATATAAGAAVLAVTSTGSMVVAAVLLAVAVGDRRSGLAAVLAVTSVAVRFSTASFDELAGIQSVLGSAGVVGPPAAAASAWAAGAAVLLAVRDPDPRAAGPGALADRAVVALAGGALAAAIVAGPGPGDDLWLRVLATIVISGAALASLRLDRRSAISRFRPALAVAAGVAAVVLAAWPS